MASLDAGKHGSPWPVAKVAEAIRKDTSEFGEDEETLR